MTENYTTSFIVQQSPLAAFEAITNVRGWWSENLRGRSDTLGQAFNYAYKDIHSCRIEITELVSGKRVAWHVLENTFSFTNNEAEWVGTSMIFDISSTPEGTRVHFTHVGLLPEDECYDACSNSWRIYINSSLRDLITTGKGQPNEAEALGAGEPALSA